MIGKTVGANVAAGAAVGDRTAGVSVAVGAGGTVGLAGNGVAVGSPTTGAAGSRVAAGGCVGTGWSGAAVGWAGAETVDAPQAVSKSEAMITIKSNARIDSPLQSETCSDEMTEKGQR